MTNGAVNGFTVFTGIQIRAEIGVNVFANILSSR